MTKETLNGMTKKERLAIYKNGEKQTIHFMSIIRGSMIKKRAVVLGDFAVDNYGQVLESTNENGYHVHGLSKTSYPKWKYTID